MEFSIYCIFTCWSAQCIPVQLLLFELLLSLAAVFSPFWFGMGFVGKILKPDGWCWMPLDPLLRAFRQPDFSRVDVWRFLKTRLNSSWVEK